MALGVSQGDKPQNHSDALRGEDEIEWKLAIEFELSSLEENNPWEPCVLPVGRNAIPVKWSFKRKLNAEGKVCRYKGRLVCKGVDFFETFAPVAKFASIGLLDIVVALDRLNLIQMDEISHSRILTSKRKSMYCFLKNFVFPKDDKRMRTFKLLFASRKVFTD
jgi:hypothetical protein